MSSYAHLQKGMRMFAMFKGLFLILALFFTSLSQADEIDDLIRLKTYIAKYCRVNCVDAGVLLQALHDVKDNTSVNPRHMLAIIRTESAFNVKASNLGNKGLSQVLLRYHRGKFKSTNYFEPSDNIRVGSSIFEACVKKHRSNTRQSFRCYNGYHLGDKKYYIKIQNNLKEIDSLSLTTV